jgi:muramoyltetrapeptide carboxypeptidase
MDLDFLKKGDIIDVVASSFGDFKVETQSIERFIESLGYKARIPEDLQKEGEDLFSAHTKEIRARHLIDALSSEDSKIVWMFRGGYGAMQLIPELEKHDFSSKNKILIGFSDITALGLYFESKYGWKFIHARMLSSFAKNEDAPRELELMKSLLSGEWDKIEYNLSALNEEAKKEVCIESQITGGNLALTECSLGTSWQIDTKDKILFIEDVGVRGYAVDRMLEHMKQAKCFENIDALIIGNIMCMPEASGKALCDGAIARFIKDLEIPVFGSDDFGHGKVNLPLVLNATVELIGGTTPRLVFQNKVIDET